MALTYIPGQPIIETDEPMSPKELAETAAPHILAHFPGVDQPNLAKELEDMLAQLKNVEPKHIYIL